MGKGSPKAPAAPDPVATANAQSQMNKDTAVAQAYLNRADQYTPWGSNTWTTNGTNPDGTPRFTNTVTLSPDQQSQLDQQNKLSSALTALAGTNVDRVANAQSQNMDFSGFQPLRSSDAIRASTGPTQMSIDSAGGLVRGVATEAYQRQIADAGKIERNIAGAGNIQKGLDYSSLGAMPTADSFNDTAKAAQKSVYDQAASRLDPQFAQRESDMKAQLAAKGITENSDAYRRELDNFGRDRTDAYNQANYSAVQAGLNAQQQGYNQALSTRQQGVGEINTQGGFANQAQQQQYGQNANNAAFTNTAQQQQFGQNAAQQQAYNSALDSEFAQRMANAQLNNAAQNQQYTQNANNAAFTNTTQNQRFQQGMQSAQLDAANRQQQIQEATYQRNLPINDIAALLGSAGGVSQPQFNSYGQVGVSPVDYMGAVNNNYNAQMNQYNQAQQNRSSGLGSIFGALGSIGGAIISDRRLKHDIKRVGTLANGVATYVFSYIGDTARQFGVMAQDMLKVKPEAVIVGDDGYMAVDYGKVW